MKIWLITMTERTDGRTDGRWTVGGRTPGRKNPRIWLIYSDGWLAGWLAKTLVPEARAGGRTKNGRTDGRTVDGRWTDGGRTPGRKNPGMYENMKI